LPLNEPLNGNLARRDAMTTKNELMNNLSTADGLPADPPPDPNGGPDTRLPDSPAPVQPVTSA
jgi:hypothetical protein